MRGATEDNAELRLIELLSHRKANLAQLIVVSDRKARSSPSTVRRAPVTVSMPVERLSSEQLPAITSTGPGSVTSSPERRRLVAIVGHT
jgi:hypothetical protein